MRPHPRSGCPCTGCGSPCSATSTRRGRKPSTRVSTSTWRRSRGHERTRSGCASSDIGLPVYRLWVTLFGDLNEAWAEAEYESLDQHVEAIERARENPEWVRVFRAMLGHTVPGTMRDYPLEPLDLT